VAAVRPGFSPGCQLARSNGFLRQLASAAPHKAG
jgi:hypothetical protein